MTTTHSRADALTDDERIVLKTLANWRGLGNRERSALMKILAAPPVEQPEFTDECADCGCLHPGEYWVHPRVWSGSGMAVDGGKLCLVCLEARLQRRLTVADFPADAAINRCVLWDLSEQPAAAPIYPQGVMDIPPYSPSGSGQSQATSALTWNAPAPADERAAFVERVMGMFEAWPNGKPGPTDEPESHYRFGYNTALEDVLTALDVGSPTRRAASANETGAEGAAIELLRKFMEYRDSDYVPNVLFDCARTIIDNAMAAAAPIPEDCDVRNILLDVVPGEDGEGQEVYARNVADVERLLSEMGEKLDAAKQPAPSPADERAAFEAWCDRFPEISAVERLRDAWQEARAVLPEDRIDWIANTHCPGGTAYPVNVKNAIREALHEARISDNETGAEGAIVGAWLTEDGRAISAEQKAGMLRDGGAGASSVQPYSIPCYLGAASAMAAEAVAFEITEQAAAEWASRHDVDHVLKHFSTQRNAIEDARTLHLLAAAPQPAQAGARVGLTDAARDVLDERHRQIYAEGWTPAHDDQHDECEMALAAIVYAESAVGYHPSCPDTWPWSPKWFKPTTPRRDLVKAGALILAELERLDRAALLNGADHDQ